MALIELDTYRMLAEMRSIFQADSTLNGAVFTIQSEPDLSPEMDPWIGLFSETVDTPEGQPISAGQRANLLVGCIVAVYAFHLESLADAMRQRDRMVGRVLTSIMRNRSLNGVSGVRTTIIRSVELDSARISGGTGFLSGGEIRVDLDVQIRTA